MLIDLSNRQLRGVLARLPPFHRRFTPYLFLLPCLIMLIALVVYPLIFSFGKTFTYYQLVRPQDQRFIGLANYAFLLTVDTQFRNSLWLTLIFTAVSVAAELFIGGCLALWVFRFRRWMTIPRLLLTTPILMAPVVVALTWRFMYNPENGVINAALGLFGLSSINWLQQTSTALPSVIITEVWQWAPFVFLVLFAGMSSLPSELYEVAQVDGASYLQYALGVIIPMLRPVVSIVLLLRVIDAFKSFDLVYVLTNGGPGTATYLLSLYTWVVGFHTHQIGVASALSYVVVLLLTGVTFLLVRSLREELPQ